MSSSRISTISTRSTYPIVANVTNIHTHANTNVNTLTRGHVRGRGIHKDVEHPRSRSSSIRSRSSSPALTSTSTSTSTPAPLPSLLTSSSVNSSSKTSIVDIPKYKFSSTTSPKTTETNVISHGFTNTIKDGVKRRHRAGRADIISKVGSSRSVFTSANNTKTNSTQTQTSIQNQTPTPSLSSLSSLSALSSLSSLYLSSSNISPHHHSLKILYKKPFVWPRWCNSKRPIRSKVTSAPLFTELHAVEPHYTRDGKRQLVRVLPREEQNDQLKIMTLGAEVFSNLWSAIDNATREICMESYFIGDDFTGIYTIDRLCTAARRGVDVYFIYDAFGSFEIGTGTRLLPLIEAGVHVIAFNYPIVTRPFFLNIFHRDHRKNCVIDGFTAFTGGMNCADDYNSRDDTDQKAYRDVHMRIYGPSALRIRRQFIKTLQSQAYPYLHKILSEEYLIIPESVWKKIKPVGRRYGFFNLYYSYLFKRMWPDVIKQYTPKMILQFLDIETNKKNDRDRKGKEIQYEGEYNEGSIAHDNTVDVDLDVGGGVDVDAVDVDMMKKEGKLTQSQYKNRPKTDSSTPIDGTLIESFDSKNSDKNDDKSYFENDVLLRKKLYQNSIHSTDDHLYNKHPSRFGRLNPKQFDLEASKIHPTLHYRLEYQYLPRISPAKIKQDKSLIQKQKKQQKQKPQLQSQLHSQTQTQIHPSHQNSKNPFLSFLSKTFRNSNHTNTNSNQINPSPFHDHTKSQLSTLYARTPSHRTREFYYRNIRHNAKRKAKSREILKSPLSLTSIQAAAQEQAIDYVFHTLQKSRYFRDRLRKQPFWGRTSLGATSVSNTVGHEEKKVLKSQIPSSFLKTLVELQRQQEQQLQQQKQRQKERGSEKGSEEREKEKEKKVLGNAMGVVTEAMKAVKAAATATTTSTESTDAIISPTTSVNMSIDPVKNTNTINSTNTNTSPTTTTTTTTTTATTTTPIPIQNLELTHIKQKRWKKYTILASASIRAALYAGRTRLRSSRTYQDIRLGGSGSFSDIVPLEADESIDLGTDLDLDRYQQYHYQLERKEKQEKKKKLRKMQLQRQQQQQQQQLGSISNQSLTDYDDNQLYEYNPNEKYINREYIESHKSLYTRDDINRVYSTYVRKEDDFIISNTLTTELAMDLASAMGIHLSPIELYALMPQSSLVQYNILHENYKLIQKKKKKIMTFIEQIKAQQKEGVIAKKIVTERERDREREKTLRINHTKSTSTSTAATVAAKEPDLMSEFNIVNAEIIDTKAATQSESTMVGKMKNAETETETETEKETVTETKTANSSAPLTPITPITPINPAVNPTSTSTTPITLQLTIDNLDKFSKLPFDHDRVADETELETELEHLEQLDQELDLQKDHVHEQIVDEIEKIGIQLHEKKHKTGIDVDGKNVSISTNTSNNTHAHTHAHTPKQSFVINNYTRTDKSATLRSLYKRRLHELLDNPEFATHVELLRERDRFNTIDRVQQQTFQSQQDELMSNHQRVRSNSVSKDAVSTITTKNTTVNTTKTTSPAIGMNAEDISLLYRAANNQYLSYETKLKLGYARHLAQLYSQAQAQSSQASTPAVPPATDTTILDTSGIDTTITTDPSLIPPIPSTPTSNSSHSTESSPIIASWSNYLSDKITLSSFQFQNVHLRVLDSNVYQRRFVIHRYYRGLIRSARTSIVISNPYIIPPPWFHRDIKAALRRGVKVYILSGDPHLSDLPSVGYAFRNFHEEYIRLGCRIFEYTKRTLHGKTVVVDNKHVCIGSFNLDSFSSGVNLENTIAIRNRRDIARAVNSKTKLDMLYSREITLENIQKIRYIERLRIKISLWWCYLCYRQITRRSVLLLKNYFVMTKAVLRCLLHGNMISVGDNGRRMTFIQKQKKKIAKIKQKAKVLQQQQQQQQQQKQQQLDVEKFDSTSNSNTKTVTPTTVFNTFLYKSNHKMVRGEHHRTVRAPNDYEVGKMISKKRKKYNGLDFASSVLHSTNIASINNDNRVVDETGPNITSTVMNPTNSTSSANSIHPVNLANYANLTNGDGSTNTSNMNTISYIRSIFSVLSSYISSIINTESAPKPMGADTFTSKFQKYTSSAYYKERKGRRRRLDSELELGLEQKNKQKQEQGQIRKSDDNATETSNSTTYEGLLSRHYKPFLSLLNLGPSGLKTLALYKKDQEERLEVAKTMAIIKALRLVENVNPSVTAGGGANGAVTKAITATDSNTTHSTAIGPADDVIIANHEQNNTTLTTTPATTTTTTNINTTPIITTPIVTPAMFEFQHLYTPSVLTKFLYRFQRNSIRVQYTLGDSLRIIYGLPNGLADFLRVIPVKDGKNQIYIVKDGYEQSPKNMSKTHGHRMHYNNHIVPIIPHYLSKYINVSPFKLQYFNRYKNIWKLIQEKGIYNKISGKGGRSGIGSDTVSGTPITTSIIPTPSTIFESTAYKQPLPSTYTRNITKYPISYKQLISSIPSIGSIEDFTPRYTQNVKDHRTEEEKNMYTFYRQFYQEEFTEEIQNLRHIRSKKQTAEITQKYANRVERLNMDDTKDGVKDATQTFKSLDIPFQPSPSAALENPIVDLDTVRNVTFPIPTLPEMQETVRKLRNHSNYIPSYSPLLVPQHLLAPRSELQQIHHKCGTIYTNNVQLRVEREAQEIEKWKLKEREKKKIIRFFSFLQQSTKACLVYLKNTKIVQDAMKKTRDKVDEVITKPVEAKVQQTIKYIPFYKINIEKLEDEKQKTESDKNQQIKDNTIVGEQTKMIYKSKLLRAIAAPSTTLSDPIPVSTPIPRRLYPLFKLISKTSQNTIQATYRLISSKYIVESKSKQAFLHRKKLGIYRGNGERRQYIKRKAYKPNHKLHYLMIKYSTLWVLKCTAFFLHMTSKLFGQEKRWKVIHRFMLKINRFMWEHFFNR